MIRTFIIICSLVPLVLMGANTTTPGTVTLLSTFECISVRAAYTGDDNSNNTAFIQYRLTGDTSWKDAYTPIIDRRTEVVIVGTTNSNSANIRQTRGSIVGLIPNTAYDVKITWTDTDGIVGSASSTNTVRTLTYFPPTGGGTKYVDASAGSEGIGTIGSPFKTITNAIVQSSAGDTILVAPGSYVPFTISKSGSAGNYFVLRTNGTPAATISGGSSITLQVNANFWLIDGFELAQSQFSGVSIGAANHHIYVENTLQTNAFAFTNGATAAGGCALLNSGVHDIFLFTNRWAIFNWDITNTQHGAFNNIDISGAGPDYTIVIAHNTLNGGWDAIGNRSNSGFLPHCENSDFCYNSFTNWIDDLCEFDGLGPNIRFFGNTARRNVLGKLSNGTSPYGGSLFSDCGSYIGPAYIFRNGVSGVYTNSDGTDSGTGLGIKIGGHSSVGWAFYFHNVWRTESSAGAHEVVSESGGPGCPNRSMNKTLLNNIFVSRGNIYYQGGATNLHDYDVCFKVGTADFASSWNCTATSYNSFGLFVAGAGQETHGFGTDPLLDANLRIATNSSAIDAGLILTNFNDSSSAWAFAGAGPDIGAFENMTNTPGVTNATLAVTSANPASGVAIMVSPTDLNGNDNGTTCFTRLYTTNIAVTLTAPATAITGGVTNIFSRWQLDGTDLVTNVSAMVTMDTGHVMNAVYLTVPPPDVVLQTRARRSYGMTIRR